MTFTVRLETYNGATKKINLPSRGAVAQFINTYPNQLPVGVSVKLDCDAKNAIVKILRLELYLLAERLTND